MQREEIVMDESVNTSENPKKLPPSTELILAVFVGYFFLSIFAAIYFVNLTKVNLFRLTQIASVTSNISRSSLEIPLCVAPSNQLALKASYLENEYIGNVYSIEPDFSSQSAKLRSSITLKARSGDLFTYYITKDENERLKVFDDIKFTEESRSIASLKVGDRISIKERLNLRLPPTNSKVTIEITKY